MTPTHSTHLRASSVLPATSLATPPAAAHGSRTLVVTGVAAAVCIAGLIAIAFIGDGKQLEAWLSPLGFLQQPLSDLSAASRGGDAADGIEYVVFLRDGASHEALSGFFQAHPAVRFVSPGVFPGVAVVRIRGEVGPSLGSLREQPQVMMTLKSRLGMVCH